MKQTINELKKLTKEDIIGGAMVIAGIINMVVLISIFG